MDRASDRQVQSASRIERSGGEMSISLSPPAGPGSEARVAPVQGGSLEPYRSLRFWVDALPSSVTNFAPRCSAGVILLAQVWRSTEGHWSAASRSAALLTASISPSPRISRTPGHCLCRSRSSPRPTDGPCGTTRGPRSLLPVPADRPSRLWSQYSSLRTSLGQGTGRLGLRLRLRDVGPRVRDKPGISSPRPSDGRIARPMPL